MPNDIAQFTTVDNKYQQIQYEFENVILTMILYNYCLYYSWFITFLLSNNIEKIPTH